MVRDEFNKIEITNDKQLKGVEFGKTQKVEFTAKKENELPEGDLNEKFVGKTIKKVTEVNVDYIQKVPTHSTTTVIQSTATTATSAAAAAASTVVAASTVAVVAIATVTGISVALHNYHIELTSLFITSNEITYSMSIVDENREDGGEYLQYEEGPRPRYLAEKAADGDEPVTGDDNDYYDEPHWEEDYDPEGIYDSNRPFVLTVSNGYYEATHYLNYGNSSEQTFSGLTLGDTYRITLKENRYGGEVIYDEAFTTYKNSAMRYFYLSGAADYHEGTFEVYMDYIDELETLNGFYLTLTDSESSRLTYTYELDKVYGSQNVSIHSSGQQDSSLDFDRTYNYSFSYQKGEEVIDFATGEVSFYNISPLTSEVYGVNWDKTANFIDKTFTVSLDFQDDFNQFSEFELNLADKEYPEEVSETFTLEKTTDPQTINLYDSSIYLRRTYTYEFSYYDSTLGDRVSIESGEVLFTDNSNGKKEFRSITIDSVPDLENHRFGVTLDYDDDYDELYSFCLVLTGVTGGEQEIYLEKTTDKQYVDYQQYQLDIHSTYVYSLKYYDAETDENYTPVSEETLSFDLSSFNSNFNGLIFDKKGNFDTLSFDVQLDYVDDYNYYSDFTFTIKDDQEQEKTFNLEKTTDPQTLYIDDTEEEEFDGEINVVNLYSMRASTFTYVFKYYDASINDYVTEESDEFTFTNTLVSTFTDIVSPFDFTADDGGQSYTLPLRFEFDDAGQIYQEFDVQICKDGESVSSLRFEGNTKTEEWLYGVFVLDGLDINDIINADDTSIQVFTYVDESLNPNVDPNIFEEPIFTKDVKFTLGKDHEIYGGRITYDHIMYNSDIGFQLVYSGHPEEYTECELVFEGASGKTYRFSIAQLSPGNNYTTIYMDSDYVEEAVSEADFQNDFIENPVKVSVVYYTLTTEVASGDAPGGTGFTQVKNGPFTTVLHESFQFYESV